MNNKAVTLSLFMAIVAIFFVDSYVSSIEEAAKKKFGTEVNVLVAKKDIREMETITEIQIGLKKIPKRFREPAAITYTGDLEGKGASKIIQKLAGSVAIVPIKQDEQITFNKLTEPNVRTGLSPQVTPGRRALAIPVNETSGVGKLVKPGDRVDVISIIDVGQQKKLAKTILQDVIVLAVGRNVTNNIPRILEPGSKGRPKVKNLTRFDAFTSVTLEVEPSQAQTLALVMGSGSNSLMLSLRNNDDTEKLKLSGVSMKEVLGPDASRVPASSKPQQGRRRRR